MVSRSSGLEYLSKCLWCLEWPDLTTGQAVSCAVQGLFQGLTTQDSLSAALSLEKGEAGLRPGEVEAFRSVHP